MQLFMSGLIFMGYIVGSLFFLRFYHQTKDRLFMLFSLSFGLLALQRISFLLIGDNDEASPVVLSLRLLAFLVIIAAIVDKNRK
jgi:hypothetical protein